MRKDYNLDNDLPILLNQEQNGRALRNMSMGVLCCHSNMKGDKHQASQNVFESLKQWRTCLHSILFPWGFYNHKLSDFKQQTFSQFWRLDVLNQDVGRATLFLKVLECGWWGVWRRKDLSLPLPTPGSPRRSLASGSINPTSASVFTWPSSLCVSMSSHIRTAAIVD